MRPTGRRTLLAVALIAPVVLHGAYDFVRFVNDRAQGAFGRLWYVLFVYDIDLAPRRMLRKLQHVQQGASAEELVRRVRLRLGLSSGDE